MPVTAVTKQTKVSQNRICHLIRSRVKEAWEKTDWSTLERLGVVETSSRKGHSYGTAFLEIDGRETQWGNGASKVAQLLFFTPGKDKATFDAFVAELNNRGFDPSQIGEIAMDMSKAFIAGAGEHFPQARLCFDRFHVMKLCGNAIDAVRKEVVSKSGSLPRGAMWALRGNAANLSEKRLALRQSVCREHAKIGRALAIRDYLADSWNYAGKQEADEHLKAVISWCARSRMEPFVKHARALKHTWKGYSVTSKTTRHRQRSMRSTDYCSSHAAAHGDTGISLISKRSHTELRAARKFL